MNTFTRIRCIRHFSVVAGLLLCLRPAVAQLEHTREGFTFLPGGPLMLPLIAADQEPRVGIRKEIGSSRLNLDIGAMFDLAEYSFAEDVALRAGVDFFTYALTSSFSGHRLQVDAVDGFFGGHLLYRAACPTAAFFLRLRVLHRSAHFLDGHYNNALNEWRDGREPIPFTKDFGEFLIAYTWDRDITPMSAYAGISYSTLIRPVGIERTSASFGFELSSGSLLGSVIGAPFALFASYNGSLDAVPRLVETSVVLVGVKFGTWQGQGVRLVAGYRSGLEMYGEYYDERRDYWTIGILFDVW